MENEIGVTLNPVSTETQKSNFHKGTVIFLKRDCSTFFSGFWRLLGRLKNEKKKDGKKREKGETK